MRCKYFIGVFMAVHDFMLTYSVSPCAGKEQSVADKVRKKIAEISEWNKLEGVETAFSGFLYLYNATDSDKRTEAEKDVVYVFKGVLRSLGAYDDVWVYVALSVDGLGKCIEFKI